MRDKPSLNKVMKGFKMTHNQTNILLNTEQTLKTILAKIKKGEATQNQIKSEIEFALSNLSNVVKDGEK